MDPRIKELVERPLNDAKRSIDLLPRAPRRSLTEEEKIEAARRRANAAVARHNARLTHLERQDKLLRYYATTTVPAERVAAHLGIEDVEEVQKKLEALRKET